MPPIDTVDLRDHDLGATLAALKASVRAATDFMVPWDLFHDEFAAKYALAPLGELRSNPALVRAFAQLAERHLGVTATVAESRIVYIPKHHFWHGYVQIADAWVFFFNFEDASVGLAAFKRDLDAADVVLVRMTTLPISKGAPPGTVQ